MGREGVLCALVCVGGQRRNKVSIPSGTSHPIRSAQGASPPPNFKQRGGGGECERGMKLSYESTELAHSVLIGNVEREFLPAAP